MLGFRALGLGLTFFGEIWLILLVEGCLRLSVRDEERTQHNFL